MYKILYNYFHCIQPYRILIQIRAFNHYLLKKLTEDNLEAIQVIFKINLLLSQSVKVLGFSQSDHLYFTTDTT